MTDSTKSLKEFRDVIVRLNDDVQRCLTQFHATAEDDADGRAFWRRMCARTVCALIDAATHGMMFHAYAARNRPGVTFSLDELARLKAASELTTDPEVEPVPVKTQMLDDMEFAFSAFAQAHFSDYVLPTSDPAWVLVKAIAYFNGVLRDPKEVRGLTLKDEDVGVLAKGLQWFMERMVDMEKSCHEAMLEKNQPVM